MNDGIKKLKDIGAQKIYEQTHIPVVHIQAILHESFEGFSKVQFIGFINILQREYEVDLSEVLQKGEAYFADKNQTIANGTNGVFVSSDKTKNYTPIYIVLALIAFVIVAYLSINSSESSKNILLKDNRLIEDVTKEMNQTTALADENTTAVTSTAQKEVSSQKTEEQEQKVEEVAVPQEKVIAESFKIKPKAKVWLGYIDVEKNKKYQKTFKNTLELDPSKEWLLTFGHGFVDIMINGEVKKFTSRKGLKFHYKDGEIKQISAEEFKRFNRGRSW